MNSHSLRRALFGLFVIVGVVTWYAWLDKYITFENVKEHRAILNAFVEIHYSLSVMVFMAMIMTTGFFLPATVPMLLVGGFLFGIFWGTVYSIIGFMVGSIFAFLLSRYFIGRWVQHKYGNQLEVFNEEVLRHGYNYLLILRMIPLFPSLTVNYFAGLTRMPLSRYTVSTVFGMLPCSLIYSFAGKEFGSIEAPGEMISAKFIGILCLLVLIVILPVIYHHKIRLKDKRQA